jgi:hypothetical protein
MLGKFTKYLEEVTYVSICGGMAIENQINQLKTNPDVIIATPGRLIDMLYNYFCILFYDYKLLIIPNIHHSLEFSNSEIVEYVDTNMCKLYWVNFNAYKQNSEYYKNNNFIIVYHLDRIDFPIY